MPTWRRVEKVDPAQFAGGRTDLGLMTSLSQREDPTFGAARLAAQRLARCPTRGRLELT
jgi:hypothetical protein